MMGSEQLATNLIFFASMLVISIILGYVAQKTKHLRIGDD